MELNEDTMGALAGRVADALGEQAELQVELVKAEIAREVGKVRAEVTKVRAEVTKVGMDAKDLGTNLLPIAAAVPLLGFGYALGCVAAALALAPFLGVAGGLTVLAVFNLVTGGIVIRRSLTRLQSNRIFGMMAGLEQAAVADESLVPARSPHADIEVPLAR